MHLLIGFLIYFLVVIYGCRAEYGDRIKNATVTWGDNLDMDESRHSYAVAPLGPGTDLPVTFQAPYINAKDYWSDPGRRTVLDYQSYVPQDLFSRPLNDGINTFYDIMHQFFGIEEPPRRQPNYQPHRQQQYEYDFPYYHPPPPKHYQLPGPKPLRASVQKLEPPRNYFPPPVEHPSTSMNYPHFVKILNDVLIENGYKESPVLEKPEYSYEQVMPTTYKPQHPRYKLRTTTQLPFPGSIQDQLPPVKYGQDTRIPYVPETTTRINVQPTAGTKVVFPVHAETVPPLDYAIDVRNAQRPITRRPPSPEKTTTSTTTTETTRKTIPEPTTLMPIKDIEISTNGETGIEVTQLKFNEYHSTIVGEDPRKNEAIISTSQSSIILTSDQNLDAQQQQILITATPKSATELLETTTAQITTRENELDTTLIGTPKSTTTADTIADDGAPKSTTLSPLQSQQSEIRPVVTELLNTMEPLEHSRFNGPFPKKLHSRKVTTEPTDSADYVTDLTLQGLNDSNAVHASVSKYPNTINMTSVIGYVIDKLNATAPPQIFNPLDDSLSLDAKILKDTNWDGFQSVIPTTDRVAEMTTLWRTVPTTTILSITATEFIATETTTPPTTTPEATTLLAEQQTAVIATRVTQSISKSPTTRLNNSNTTEETSTTDLPIIEPPQPNQTNLSQLTRVTTTAEPATRFRPRQVVTEEVSSTPYATITERMQERLTQNIQTTTEETTERNIMNLNGRVRTLEFTTEFPITQKEPSRAERTNQWWNRRNRLNEEELPDQLVEAEKQTNTDEIQMPQITTQLPLTSTSNRSRKYQRKPPVRKYPKFQEKALAPITDTGNIASSTQHEANIQAAESISEASSSESPRRGRKYQRKPPVNQFVQFQEQKSTEAPLRLGTLTRPFYPKRNRPNVTLTFGNHASKRVDGAEGKKPERVASQEEIKARRTLYRRRMYPSQLRRATTEDSVTEES